MSARKIKLLRKGKPKIRGRNQNRRLQAIERENVRQALRDQARHRRLTKRDGETGEIYVLARLALKDKGWSVEYKRGLDEAVAAVPAEADEQAEAIRAYLQQCVDSGRMVVVPCERGTSPTCKVYQGSPARVVVMRQDDPDLK